MLQMELLAGKGLVDYFNSRNQAKGMKAFQKYKNTMTMLSAAQSQNAITTNWLLERAAFAEQGIDLQKQSMITSARVESAAAGAGVKGRSVNQAMFDVARNAANQ